MHLKAFWKTCSINISCCKENKKLHFVGKDNVEQLLYISVYLLSMQLIPRVNIKKKRKKKQYSSGDNDIQKKGFKHHLQPTMANKKIKKAYHHYHRRYWIFKMLS